MPGSTDSDTAESKPSTRAKLALRPVGSASDALGQTRPKLGVLSPPSSAANRQIKHPKARSSKALGSLRAETSTFSVQDDAASSFPPQLSEHLSAVQTRSARRRSDHLDRIYKALLALAIVVTLVSLLPRPTDDSTSVNDGPAEAEQVVDSGSPDAPPPNVLIQTD